MAEINWVLKPFGEDLMVAVRLMRERLVSMSDEDLDRLEGLVDEASETNVWWVSYRAAQILRDEIYDELTRRSKS
jgi:hypothetical protein